MRIEEVLILDKRDLFKVYENSEIEEIDGLSFPPETRDKIKISHLAIFLDGKGKSKVLKSRWGDRNKSCEIFDSYPIQ